MAGEGVFSKLYVEPGASPHTFDTSSELVLFENESMKTTKTPIDTMGMRGTRSLHAGRVVDGLKEINGSIAFYPSREQLDLWLPRILGAAESTDDFALAETLPTFGVLIDKDAQTYEYKDCKVSRATFSGSSGQCILLTLDLIALDSADGTSAPSVSYSASDPNRVMAFHEGVLSMESANREFEQFSLVIDNLLSPRFGNSQTANALEYGGRDVTLQTTHPFSSTLEGALYDLGATGTDSATLTWTYENMSTTVSFGTLIAPTDTPTMQQRGANRMVFNWKAYQNGSNDEIAFNNDSVNTS